MYFYVVQKPYIWILLLGKMNLDVSSSYKPDTGGNLELLLAKTLPNLQVLRSTWHGVLLSLLSLLGTCPRYSISLLLLHHYTQRFLDTSACTCHSLTSQVPASHVPKCASSA